MLLGLVVVDEGRVLVPTLVAHLAGILVDNAGSDLVELVDVLSGLVVTLKFPRRRAVDFAGHTAVFPRLLNLDGGAVWLVEGLERRKIHTTGV